MSITKMRKIIAVCAAWVGAAIAAPAIWDGTADVSWYKPDAQKFTLMTAEELAGVAKLVNEGTSDFSGQTIALGADIFLNDTAGAEAGTWASVPHTEWNPIGTSSRPFKGEFDGIAGKKNRKIYGLYVSDATKDYVGLFGYTGNVKISNLDVLVGRITARNYAGALVGKAAGGSITNVHSEVRVSGNNHVGGLVGYFTGSLMTSSVKENVVGQDSVGGLIGITTGSVAGTTKSNSYFTGNVSGRKYVGGLVGAGSSISKSYAEGIVKGDSSYVGGVVGFATGSLDSVYHVGGNVSGFSYVAGLAGYVKGNVTKSYSEGEVSAMESYVGGAVGYAAGAINFVHHVDGGIRGSFYVGGVAGYVVGAIDSAYHVGGDVVGTRHYVGGLVGYGTAISKSYAEGVVRGDSNYVGGVAGYATKNIDSSYHSGGYVSGYSYIGGLVGKIDSTVIKCYSEGDVFAKGNNAGGLIGLSYYSYSGSTGKTVNVSLKSFAVSQVKGNNNVGGLLGQDSVYRPSSSTATLYRQIIDSYSKGDVDGNMYVGGVVGKFYSSVTKKTVEFIGTSYHSEGSVIGKSNYVGGIAGSTRGVISSSQHYGGDISGYSYVGGLAGSIDSTIVNSYSNGNVTGVGNYVGGLVGFSFYRYEGSSSANMIAMRNSYFTGNVKGNSFVGGLVGLDSTYRAVSNTYTVTRNIKKSHSYGNVEGNLYVGGIVGNSNYGANSSTNNAVYNSIDSCFHDGGDVTGQGYVAGLVGYMKRGSVTNSYSKANVYGTKHYVGGLVGYGYDISASYAEGTVKSDSNYVGGVAGCATGSIIDLVNHVGGDVFGFDNVGGVIGLALRLANASFKDSTYIKNSYSDGDVVGNNSVGGLIGSDSLHRVLTKGQSNSTYKFIIRHVSGLSSSGNVKGKKYVGGLIGKQSVGSDSSNKYIGKTTFEILLSSHNNGSVSADSNYVGGIVGLSRGSIDSAYHEGGNISGFSYVGGLAGSSGGLVKNSHSNANVEGFGLCVGGLVGSGSSIVNSYSEGNVKGDKKYVGGLVGSGNDVLNSYAKGFVSSDSSYVGGVAGRASSINSSYHIDGDIRGYGYVGGLAGVATGSISNSYSVGNVSGLLDYVGGVVGSDSGKVRNSYAVAKYVRGRNTVGGLAGYVGDSIDVSYFEGDSISGNFEIGGLAGYAKSSVDSSFSTANVNGDDNVGGLIGSAYGNVSNSYALGNVDGVGEGAGAGHDNLGGLIGYQYKGSVTKSMALGNVTGTTNLGGLIGRFDGVKISQSYANGNVTGNYYGDPADEIGNYYIGGLVGYAKGNLEETYASGVVKGVEDEPVYTGCVVGYVNGSLSVVKSYYDKTKCGLGIDGGEEMATVSGSPDKTTAEMQTQETFEDWDFVNTWKILEGTYPFLQIYSNSLTNAVVTTTSLKGIEYDGTPKTPLVTSVTLFGETLEYETEYTITYKDNINAGIASINICGVQPYGGCKVIEFEIAGIAIEPSIAAIENVTYTGRAQTPEIEVYNGETLLAAKDYAAEYKDNVNAGTATVTVTMKGNYSGSASRTFTIEKATPVISQNPTASDVVLGQTLAASELIGGYANVNGAFVWKEPATKPALENDGYTVIFVPTDADNYTNSAEITVPVNVLDLVYVVVHVDETALDSVTMVKGSSYTLPNVPNRVGYDFVGLYKGTTIVGNPGNQIAITENTVIEAVYKIQSFVITFKNGSTVLQSSVVDYGTIPVAPTVTLPENTAQYTYSFVGWDKDVVAVTEAAVYTAVIDSVVNKYEVVFKDYDGTVLMDSAYDYGTDIANIVKPISPMRDSAAQYTYAFKGWSPAVTDVTEDMVYTATYDSVVNTYRIAFVNAYDSTQSVEMEIEYGETPVYEGTPTRSATAQYAYTFSGWNPEVKPVVGNATYTALFDSTLQNYVVSFVNGSEELQSGKMAYGTLPEYAGAVPTKKATAQYTYTFKGWNPEIASVTGTVTYEAVFDSVVNKYLITFKNDSITLQSDSLAYGTIPEYPVVTLPKNTAQYTYSMSWDKEVVAVTGDAVYTMKIDSVVNNYNIVFTNFDGTILKETSYAYGTAAASIAKPAAPARVATAKFIYSFKDWSPSISDVTKDVVYKAVFDSTIRVYVITFVNGSSKLQSSEIEYGTMPSYKGDAPTKESTKEYTYSFKGWSPAIASVTGAATYMAVFDSTVRKYTVTFKNDGSVMQTISVAYGTTPVYSGATPTRAESDSCTYTFSGWNPKLGPVTGDVTFSSVYEETMKKFLVRFMNGKSTLEIISVAYGETPKYTKETPTKTPSKTYTYEFVGWTPEIGPITKTTDFMAVFDSVKTTGIADVRFANLEMSVVAVSRSIQISAAPIGASYAIFDMQGRVLKQGRVDSANFNITMPIAGNYLVKIGNRTQRVRIR